MFPTSNFAYWMSDSRRLILHTARRIPDVMFLFFLHFRFPTFNVTYCSSGSLRVDTAFMLPLFRSQFITNNKIRSHTVLDHHPVTLSPISTKFCSTSTSVICSFRKLRTYEVTETGVPLSAMVAPQGYMITVL